MAADSIFSKLRRISTNWGVTVIVVAVVMVGLVSVSQYYYTRRIIQVEAEKNVVLSLVLKAIIVKGMLNANEKIVINERHEMERHLGNTDSLFIISRRIIKQNKDIVGVGVAMKPGYDPQHSGLFEPWSYRIGDSIVARQVAGSSHDYTKKEFYINGIKGENSWSEPYYDTDATGELVSTYSMPLQNAGGDIVGVLGIDVSLSWLGDSINAHNTQQSSFSILLTEDMDLLTAPSNRNVGRATINKVVEMINDSTVERRLSGKGRCFVINFTDVDGSDGYIYYAKMRGAPHWTVAMVCYDDEVYSKLYSMRNLFFALILLCFAMLALILFRYMRNARDLQLANLERERIDSELHVAKHIQSEMLPGSAIVRNDVTAAGLLIPARDVGGDLFDHLIRDEKLYFCIGDVSGKGVPASLVMAVAHSHFCVLCQRESSPSRIMGILNEVICNGNDTNIFVTFFIGVLDLPTGRLRYCNAGHDTPLLLTPEAEPLPVKSNLPLGVMPGYSFEQQDMLLSPGRQLLLYTDGLTEQTDPERHLFGFERVKTFSSQWLSKHTDTPAKLLSALADASSAFAGGTEQHDDLTMLIVSYNGQETDLVLDESLTVASDLERVPQVNDWVKEIASRLDFDRSLTSQLVLAVEETVVNIINYAYPDDQKGEVKLDARASDRNLRFVISDSGMPFDPTHAAEADTTLSVEERPIGGLGIFLVRQLMDTINYERIDGHNVLTLTKQYKTI